MLLWDWLRRPNFAYTSLAQCATLGKSPASGMGDFSCPS
jgi:hypothetical protein